MALFDPAHTDVHLIGISGYARAVLRSLNEVLESARGRLASVTVINRPEEEAACLALEARGCRIYPDYQAMLGGLGPGKNLCIVPTSIFLHSQMTVDAVRAGADVLVEKPLAGSREEAWEMVRAGRETGRSIAVGFQDMYAPQVSEIKRALTGGAIGGIRSITVTASWPRNLAYYSRNGWAGRTHCEGRPVFDSPINNAFAHFVNLALFFAGRTAGETTSVTAVSGRLFRFFPIETFDTAQVLLETSTGCDIRCTLTHADATRLEPKITIDGEEGSLVWRQEVGAQISNLRGELLRSWVLDSEETNRRRMLEQVIRGTRTGEAPCCPAEMAVHHTEAVHQIVQSLPVENGTDVLGLRRRAEDWTPVPNLLNLLGEELLISAP